MRHHSDDSDDLEVPPFVSCTRCKRADCSGCESAPEPEREAPILAWEGKPGTVSRRLWDTALASSIDPVRTFGQLPEGRVTPALAFAFVAEALAVGSLGAAALLMMFALAPVVFARALSDLRLLSAAGSLLIGAIFVMVALHALWGVCLELGAHEPGSAVRWRQGLRFGLYACGWDLLTSPAGVLQGLGARGFTRAWAPIVSAARVPRIATHAYLERCRHFQAAARRRGILLSFAVLGSLLLAIVIVAGLLMVRLLERMLG